MTDAYHCHHGCMRNRCNDCRGRETWEVFAADGPPADPHDPYDPSTLMVMLNA